MVQLRRSTVAYQSLQYSCVDWANHTLNGRDGVIYALLHFLLQTAQGYIRLMNTGRLTVVGEAFMTASQLSVAGTESHVLLLPYGVEHSQNS